MDPAAHERHAKRRKEAERAADDLVQRRRCLLKDMINRRNYGWDTERGASDLPRWLMAEGEDDSPLWEAIWAHVLDDLEGDCLHTELERIESLPPEEFRTEFDGRERFNHCCPNQGFYDAKPDGRSTPARARVVLNRRQNLARAAPWATRGTSSCSRVPPCVLDRSVNRERDQVRAQQALC